MRRWRFCVSGEIRSGGQTIVPQQLVRCSQCRKRPEEKLSQVTWAWLRSDRVRVAYRQRLCLQCFCVAVLALDKPLDADGPASCPACGILTEDDMDPVYV